MKVNVKRELFADFEAMLDSITDFEDGPSAPVTHAQAGLVAQARAQAAPVPAFNKDAFAAALEKKKTLRDVGRFCLQTICQIGTGYAAAFYALDPGEGALHALVAHNIPPALLNKLAEYDSGSLLVRRVAGGRPTFKNFTGMHIFEDPQSLGNTPGAAAPAIVAILPVHYKYKVIGSILVLSPTEAEVPDAARSALQTIAALCGDAIAPLLPSDIPKLARTLRAQIAAAAPPAAQGPAAKTPAKKAAPSAAPSATQPSPAQVRPTQKPAAAPTAPRAPNATELLINSIPAFTFVMMMDGRIAYINKYTLDRLGYPKHEIIGSFITGLYPTGKQYTNLDRKYAILEHQEGDINYLLQAKSGTVYSVLFSVHRSRFNKKEAVICIGHEERTHHRGDDKPLGDKLESLTHELHQLKIEMEELRTYSENEEKKKEAFIEKVSYEIRSMLNAVIGMTGLLHDTKLDDEQIEYVETIRKSGDSMLEHINDIIDSLNFDPDSDEGNDAFYNRFLTTEMAEEISGVDVAGKKLLLVDPDRGNRATITRELEHIGWRVTAVATVAEAEEVVAKHNQLDGAIIDMSISRGDPRALAYAIREAYPADALFLILITDDVYDQDVVDALGSATYMQKPYDIDLVRYRLAKFLAGQQAKRMTKIPQSPDQERPLKFLLVEDNHMDQKVAQWLLNNMGYEAAIVENGIEALRAVESEAFDLIFMDIEMPEMDGLETARKIRDRIPADRQPKIIAMTAHALKGDREQYLAAGMDDYISKPINEKKLIEVLSRNVEGIGETRKASG